MVDGALIQILVGLYLVPVFVTHADEEEAPLVAIDGYLADGLVETLVEELLSNGTEADLPGLSGDESFLQLLMQLDDFDFGGRSGEDSLYPELPIVGAMFLGG